MYKDAEFRALLKMHNLKKERAKFFILVLWKFTDASLVCEQISMPLTNFIDLYILSRPL